MPITGQKRKWASLPKRDKYKRQCNENNNPNYVQLTDAQIKKIAKKENNLAATYKNQVGNRTKVKGATERPQVQLNGVGQRASNQGKMKIYSVAVGEGNATVVITPANDLFIIDIGSKTAEIRYGRTDTNPNAKGEDLGVQTLRDLLRRNDLLGQCQIVEGLLISHSDRDHYNYLSVLVNLNVWVKASYLGDAPGNHFARLARVIVSADDFVSYPGDGDNYLALLCGEAVYKSNTLSGQVNWVTYTGTVVNNNPKIKQGCPTTPNPESTNFPTPMQKMMRYSLAAKSTTENEGDLRRSIWGVPQEITISPQSANPTPPCYSTDGLTLYQQGNFAVRILVSNYQDCRDFALKVQFDAGRERTAKYEALTTKYYLDPRTKGNARDVNEASIIANICFGNLNHLVCGDAIGSTERFVSTFYPTVKNIAYLNVPHHGSKENESSSDTFTKQMNPETVVISTRRYPGPNKHPQLSTVKKYTKSDGRSSDPNMKAIYTACTDTSQTVSGDIKSLGKAYGQYVYQYKNQQFKIYVTGWLTANYHLYESDGTTSQTVLPTGNNLFKTEFS
ncbi:MAG TPA: hypothetical protein EYO33_14295 [Phycisphaerales bacterium]|nr:hypothetical protein [Phycisphaerales bacterium]